MDIKLKKSSVNWGMNGSRIVAVIIAFLVCAASFTAAATIGLTSILKTGDNGDPVRMLFAKTYQDSGMMQDEMASYFSDIVYTAANPQAHEYSKLVSSLQKAGVDFYMELSGGHVLTNMDFGGEKPGADDLRTLGGSAGAYRLYESGALSGEPELYGYRSQYGGDDWLNNMVSSYAEGGVHYAEGVTPEKLQTAYISLSDQFISQASSNYLTSRAGFINSLIVAGGFVFSYLVAFITLCFVSGRKDEYGHPVLTGIDRWFTELIIVLLGVSVYGTVGSELIAYENMVMDHYSNYYAGMQGSSFIPSSFGIGLCAAILFAWAVVGLLLVMALVKKIKARRFFRDFFVVKICSWIWSGLKEIYYGSSVMKKVILVVALMCLCSATIVFFPVVIVVSLVFAAKWVKQYEAIRKGISQVKDGNPSYKIPIEGEPKGELQQLAADINAISEGFDVAVKQELKNQRMKTELISNVSHDIKTPLTSIITYVDLLKKEGLDCEDAPKYLDILDQKSTRLRKLTEDLFEAAKASSGDIPVNLERVDLMYLLNQTLGELSDRLDARGLEVIVKAEKDRFCVAADGQLMWRVLENLFGNAIKYALENSRVYVDIHEEQMHSDGRMAVVLEMKNISKNPLNIPADELMERFKRGDESRSTEGSGLGLSIARDLVTMQHGKFDLIIDGDLFKAVIMLEVCQ